MAIKTKEISATRICIDDILLFSDLESLRAELFSVTKVERCRDGFFKITGYEGTGSLRIMHFDPDERLTRISEK